MMSDQDKCMQEFEKWFDEQDMPIDISLFRTEKGFLLKREVTPLLKAGASFAWKARDSEVEEVHRIQLASISVMSKCNTEKSLGMNLIDASNLFWTPAYEDVKDAMIREIGNIEKIKQLETQLSEGREIVKGLRASECLHFLKVDNPGCKACVADQRAKAWLNKDKSDDSVC